MRTLQLVQRALSSILAQWRIRRDPIAYARRVGVSVGKGTRIYAARVGMFGSEPWMIRLGSNVHIAGECQFLTHDGGTLVLRRSDPDLEWSAPIIVEDNVFIGFRSTILPGVKIGANSVIAAGAVVTQDVLPGSVVGGVPARHIMSIDEYLSRMRAKSLGLGRLHGEDKDKALRRVYRAFLTD